MATLEEAQRKIQELETQLAASRANTAPELNAAQLNAAPAVNAIYRQPKIATFSRENPIIWFTQAEITLRNAGIVVSATKADCIAEKLDFEALQAIHDIITADPRPADIYDQVKTRLIDTYGSSAETRLRRLIKGQVSTIGKPSLVLNRLRGLNTGANDDVLRSVFLDQLSPHCRATLAISELEDLNKLAQMADKVAEATEANYSSISTVNAPEGHNVASISSQLTQILDRLAKLESARSPKTNSRAKTPRGRSCNRSQNKSRDHSASSKICRIHHKFGKEARHCIKPCSWSADNASEN